MIIGLEPLEISTQTTILQPGLPAAAGVIVWLMGLCDMEAGTMGSLSYW